MLLLLFACEMRFVCTLRPLCDSLSLWDFVTLLRQRIVGANKDEKRAKESLFSHLAHHLRIMMDYYHFLPLLPLCVSPPLSLADVAAVFVVVAVGEPSHLSDHLLWYLRISNWEASVASMQVLNWLILAPTTRRTRCQSTSHHRAHTQDSRQNYTNLVVVVVWRLLTLERTQWVASFAHTCQSILLASRRTAPANREPSNWLLLYWLLLFLLVLQLFLATDCKVEWGKEYNPIGSTVAEIVESLERCLHPKTAISI